MRWNVKQMSQEFIIAYYGQFISISENVLHLCICKRILHVKSKPDTTYRLLNTCFRNTRSIQRKHSKGVPVVCKTD